MTGTEKRMTMNTNIPVCERMVVLFLLFIAYSASASEAWYETDYPDSVIEHFEDTGIFRDLYVGRLNRGLIFSASAYESLPVGSWVPLGSLGIATVDDLYIYKVVNDVTRWVRIETTGDAPKRRYEQTWMGDGSSSEIVLEVSGVYKSLDLVVSTPANRSQLPFTFPWMEATAENISFASMVNYYSVLSGGIVRSITPSRGWFPNKGIFTLRFYESEPPTFAVLATDMGQELLTRSGHMLQVH